jgi:hypothetical protein
VAFGVAPLPSLIVVTIAPDSVFFAPDSAAALARNPRSGFLFDLGQRRGAYLLHLLNLRTVHLQIDLLGMFQDTIDQTGFHEFQFGFVQSKRAERLADGRTEGIERFLLVVGRLRGGRPAERGYEEHHCGDGTGHMTHRRSFLMEQHDSAHHMPGSLCGSR